MGMKIDDSVKQKLLDSLAEEPPMVISTAYAYAKNYVEYGEDITKAWTTAVQQASFIQEARQKAWVEAYDYFKKDYEKCLKADMVAMLTEIREKAWYHHSKFDDDKDFEVDKAVEDIINHIDAKISSLKEGTDGNK